MLDSLPCEVSVPFAPSSKNARPSLPPEDDLMRERGVDTLIKLVCAHEQQGGKALSRSHRTIQTIVKPSENI